MASEDVPGLLPVRMLNEHVYCPRLAYLEWADRLFEENADTAEGKFAHRRAHQERGTPLEPGQRGEDAPAATAITLSSEELGLIAKIDVLERVATPSCPSSTSGEPLAAVPTRFGSRKQFSSVPRRCSCVTPDTGWTRRRRTSPRPGPVGG